MEDLPEPYVIHYPRIVAIADEAAKSVELIEFFDLYRGGDVVKTSLCPESAG